MYYVKAKEMLVSFIFWSLWERLTGYSVFNQLLENTGKHKCQNYQIKILYT